MKIGIVSASILALSAAAFAPSAQGASLVLGNSLAHDCYESAEYRTKIQTGLDYCTEALAGVMTAKERASTFVNRGILRARASNTDGAMEDYDSALAIDATLAEAFLDRSALQIGLRHFDDALRDANQAIELGAHRGEIAYYNRAVANEALGNIGAAYADYKSALQLEPRFAAASDQLMRFRVVTDDKKGT
jgi:tetratricopeptide (TPR) repeat protein